MRHLFATMLRVVPVVAVIAGCAGSSDSAKPVELNVFAASSLKEAFTEIGAAYTATHPGVTVTFNFGASSELAAQIGQGSPADVFASADDANMTKVVDAVGTVGEPQQFATNSLEIIVGAGNPKGITGLADLARPDVLFVTAAPEVPIGKYAAKVLDAAGVTVTPKSLEQNVKGIVTKVTLGEADAGIVYVTDVLAAGATATGVPFPSEINVTAHYPVAALKGTTHGDAANEFVSFVLSGEAGAILSRVGFGAP